MKRIQATKPVRHAVIWILVYIVLVNAGDVLSEMIGIPNSATSALLIVLSAALLVYVNKNQWGKYYGLRWPTRSDFQKTGFYIPLALLAFIQYAKGFNSLLRFSEIAMIIILMIGVGFIEELLFRGFLYQGVLKESRLANAVIISGLTFGIGHIVNLLRGYSLADQGMQIGIAIAIGIMLALLVAVTDSIMPGVVFHILFNISGSVTRPNLTIELSILIFSLLVCVAYSLYLKKWLTPQNSVVPTV